MTGHRFLPREDETFLGSYHSRRRQVNVPVRRGVARVCDMNVGKALQGLLDKARLKVSIRSEPLLGARLKPQGAAIHQPRATALGSGIE
jgi:hypothetical protein